MIRRIAVATFLAVIAAFSGESEADAGMIAFSAQDSTQGSINLFRIKSDGTNLTNLTPGFTTYESPSWSPDGNYIAFKSNSDIYRMNAGGWDIVNLTNTWNIWEQDPAWSPDGQWFAYHDFNDIFIVSTEGGSPLQLTYAEKPDRSPAWSPDSKKIAFISYRNNKVALYTVDIESERVEYICGDGISFMNGSSLSWSPDGSSIAFSGNTVDEAGQEIYLWNFENKETVRLTNNKSLDYDPAWSPDGSKIVFISDRDTIKSAGQIKRDLYIMDADGSGQILLASNIGHISSPEWKPDDSIVSVSNASPAPFRLEQNRPNPFNSTTLIGFFLPQQSKVSLDIYNILGVKVTTLQNSVLSAGYHTVSWKADSVSGGVFFYRLKTGDTDLTGKMLLLK